MRVALVCAANTYNAEILTASARAILHAGHEARFFQFQLPGPHRVDTAMYIGAEAPIQKITLPDWVVRWYPRLFTLPGILSPARRALSEARPDAVIVTKDSFGVYKVVVHLCYSMGVSTFVLQEGISWDSFSDKDLQMKVGIRDLFRRRYSVTETLLSMIPHPLFRRRRIYMGTNYAAVFGTAMKEVLEKLGRDPSTIYVIGNPGYDRKYPQGVQPLRPQCTTALYAHQHIPLDVDPFEHYADVIRICCKESGYKLIFKIHPRAELSPEQIQELGLQLGISRDQLVVEKDTPAEELFDRADVMLTYVSTMTYDALIQGMSVILLDYVNSRYRISRGDADPCVHADTEDDFRASLQHLRDETAEERGRRSEERNQFLRYHLYEIDGQSGSRLCKAVEDVVMERTRGREGKGTR